MELAQQEKTTLIDRDGKAQEITLQELSKLLEFTYLKNQTFFDEEIKGLLHKESAEQDQIVAGKKWKKEILSGHLASVSVRWIDDRVGYGLFAEEDLTEAVFVGEYVGEVRKNNNHLFISDYLYSLPLLDDIGRNYVIDAHRGNLLRFINHSYRPNLIPTYAFVDGYIHMILLTSTPVKKGQQLFYNYGKSYWTIRSTPKKLESGDVH